MKPLPRSGGSLEYCFARRRGALDRTSYAFTTLEAEVSFTRGEWSRAAWWKTARPRRLSRLNKLNPALGRVVTFLSIAGLIALDLRYSWAESCVLSALARSDTIALGVRGAPHCRPQVAARTMHVSVTSNWTRWSTVCRRCGFAVDAQARSSGTALALARLGIFPIYHEKNQAGLRILDRQGRPLRKSASRRRRIRISRRFPRWSSTPCCLSRIASC
jgi:hypothetical protein